MNMEKYINKVIQGDCLEVMKDIPDKSKNLSLFGEQENHWQEEWKDMPEYNNVESIPPFITALFKFRNQKDFEMFKEVLKKHLYNGEKVFDGMQRTNIKSTWFPLKEKANKYRYRNEP